MRTAFLPAALCLLLLPLTARAQSGTCDVTNITNTLTTRVGDATYVSGRARYDCTGGIRVLADSAVSAFGRLVMIGNVSFADSLKTLQSQYVQYEGRIGHIVADGPTVVTDRKTGSTLRAPNGLTYQRANKDNPQPRIEVIRGRPQMVLYEEPRPDQKVDTTTIVSDRMEIVGESLFRGWGSVEIKRGTLDATGSQTVFDDSLGIMDLWGIARIKGDRYDVRGDSIHAQIEGDLFREVRVFRDARIDSEDLVVQGQRVYIAFDSGAVHRLIALGTKNAKTTIAPATATTPNLALTADSIDALAPRQTLERVVAVGNALGSRQPDSLDLKLPELIQRDWLRGDTVIAHFVEAPDSVKARRTESDSSFSRVLDRLIAVGGGSVPATATYRIRAENDTTDQVEVGYLVARRITAMFREGSIQDLNAEGQIRGVYLQPIRVTPRRVTTDSATSAQNVRNTGRRGR
jgi:hypothetical protein